MNCRNKFKYTAVAMMVGTAMNAKAALYRVVEVAPEGIDTDYATAFGVAIQAGNVYEDTDKTTPYQLGCFDNGAACNDTTFKLAGETRTTKILSGEAVDGVSFREEAPFAMDAAFRYIEDFDDVELYCNRELRYSTCESWAYRVWEPWYQERYTLSDQSNALAFVEGKRFENEYNNVINTLTANVDAIGNQSELNPESDGSVGDKLITRNKVVAPSEPNYVKFSENDERTSYHQSRAWFSDGQYTSGSVSYGQTNDNGKYYTSKAAIWDSEGNTSVVAWPSGSSDERDRLAQGSMRDFIEVTEDGKPVIYGAGFNAYDSSENYIQATIFKGTFGETNTLKDITWKSLVVTGATSEISSDFVYTNSAVQAINKNKLAVGEAKRYGGAPEGGAAANRLFVVNNLASPTADYLSDGIFFYGIGGKVGGLNNYNEIVGQLDAEDTREVDGKARRKRGFILPYDATGTVEARRDIFQDRAWYLDDLTNGGDYSAENNQFRIIDATDINDAGVISATATMCKDGYDTFAHNSLCKGGDANAEKVVAVKLIPIASANATDIVTRSVDQAAAERQGAGLGVFALTLLGLFGFRRK
jgi:hypothetical protein